MIFTQMLIRMAPALLFNENDLDIVHHTTIILIGRMLHFFEEAG